VDIPGHPFFINTAQGTGTANTYNSGVTNNGAVSGTITFTVPTNAPNTLYYNCQFHSSMNGTITITD
jgi:plastocyanin